MRYVDGACEWRSCAAAQAAPPELPQSTPGTREQVAQAPWRSRHMHAQALARAPTPEGPPIQWPAFVLDPPPQRRNRSSLLPNPEPLPAAALWGSFTPSPPPIPPSTTASPPGTTTAAGGSERKPWVVVLLVVLICATVLCAAAALCWFLVLQKRRRRMLAAKVAQAEAAQQESWRTTQAAAGSGPVRHHPRRPTLNRTSIPGDLELPA